MPDPKPEKKTKPGSVDDSAIDRIKARQKKLKELNDALWTPPPKKK